MVKVKKKKVKKKRAQPITKKAKKKQNLKRTSEGKFPKGVCGNPKGRPKGSRNKCSAAELQAAIGTVEEEKRKTFLVTWVKAAWGDPTNMAAIANFIMPKLRAIEQVTFAADSASDEEAEKWRQEMYERFHH